MTYASVEGELLLDLNTVFPSWMDDALCAQTDPDLFFPDEDTTSSPMHDVQRAKSVCAACPVTADCLAYSVEHRIRYGVWGGLSERQRAPLLRAAAQAADPQCRNGHLRTEENTRTDGRGCLRCRDCEAGYEQRRPRKNGPAPGSGNWRRVRSGEGSWAA